MQIMPDLYDTLAKCDISYERFDHKAVFTCEESEGLDVQIPGAHTKQLLLRDKKGEHHLLAIVMHDKKVNMKELGKLLDMKHPSFASRENLKELLHVEPGSVTPFGLLFDTEHKVEVIIDEDAWKIGTLRFHPLVNTATIVIDTEGFRKFLEETGHTFKVMKIPQKKEAVETIAPQQG